MCERLLLALHLTGDERLPAMQNRFELAARKRREKRVSLIIHHDIGGELIALPVEALHRRHHHHRALAGVKLPPSSTEPPG